MRSSTLEVTACSVKYIIEGLLVSECTYHFVLGPAYESVRPAMGGCTDQTSSKSGSRRKIYLWFHSWKISMFVFYSCTLLKNPLQLHSSITLKTFPLNSFGFLITLQCPSVLDADQHHRSSPLMLMEDFLRRLPAVWICKCVCECHCKVISDLIGRPVHCCVKSVSKTEEEQHQAGKHITHES